MIFAGVSSLQNMFEAVAESLLHKFPKLSRKAVLVLLGVICLGFGIGMETIDKWGPWMDLVSIYIIPIGATLGAISWFYVMKKDELLRHQHRSGPRARRNVWYAVGRYVYVPLCRDPLLRGALPPCGVLNNKKMSTVRRRCLPSRTVSFCQTCFGRSFRILLNIFFRLK